MAHAALNRRDQYELIRKNVTERQNEKQKLKEKADEGWEKYHFPPSLLETEKDMPNMTLSKTQLDNEVLLNISRKIKLIQATMDSVGDGHQEYPALEASLKSWTDIEKKILGKKQREMINQEFIDQFVLWLQGRSKFNAPTVPVVEFRTVPIPGAPPHVAPIVMPRKVTREATPWGNKPLFHCKGVTEFLDEALTKRGEIAKFLAKLKMRTPRTLDECYLYYKFIVRQCALDEDGLRDFQEFKWYDDPPPDDHDPRGRFAGLLPAKYNRNMYNAFIDDILRGIQHGDIRIIEQINKFTKHYAVMGTSLVGENVEVFKEVFTESEDVTLNVHNLSEGERDEIYLYLLYHRLVNGVGDVRSGVAAVQPVQLAIHAVNPAAAAIPPNNLPPPPIQLPNDYWQRMTDAVGAAIQGTPVNYNHHNLVTALGNELRGGAAIPVDNPNFANIQNNLQTTINNAVANIPGVPPNLAHNVANAVVAALPPAPAPNINFTVPPDFYKKIGEAVANEVANINIPRPKLKISGNDMAAAIGNVMGKPEPSTEFVALLKKMDMSEEAARKREEKKDKYIEQLMQRLSDKETTGYNNLVKDLAELRKDFIVRQTVGVPANTLNDLNRKSKKATNKNTVTGNLPPLPDTSIAAKPSLSSKIKAKDIALTMNTNPVTAPAPKAPDIPIPPTVNVPIPVPHVNQPLPNVNQPLPQVSQVNMLYGPNQAMLERDEQWRQYMNNRVQDIYNLIGALSQSQQNVVENLNKAIPVDTNSINKATMEMNINDRLNRLEQYIKTTGDNLAKEQLRLLQEAKETDSQIYQKHVLAIAEMNRTSFEEYTKAMQKGYIDVAQTIQMGHDKFKNPIENAVAGDLGEDVRAPLKQLLTLLEDDRIDRKKREEAFEKLAINLQNFSQNNMAASRLVASMMLNTFYDVKNKDGDTLNNTLTQTRENLHYILQNKVDANWRSPVFSDPEFLDKLTKTMTEKDAINNVIENPNAETMDTLKDFIKTEVAMQNDTIKEFMKTCSDLVAGVDRTTESADKMLEQQIKNAERHTQAILQQSAKERREDLEKANRILATAKRKEKESRDLVNDTLQRVANNRAKATEDAVNAVAPVISKLTEQVANIKYYKAISTASDPIQDMLEEEGKEDILRRKWEIKKNGPQENLTPEQAIARAITNDEARKMANPPPLVYPKMNMTEEEKKEFDKKRENDDKLIKEREAEAARVQKAKEERLRKRKEEVEKAKVKLAEEKRLFEEETARRKKDWEEELARKEAERAEKEAKEKKRVEDELLAAKEAERAVQERLAAVIEQNERDRLAKLQEDKYKAEKEEIERAQAQAELENKHEAELKAANEELARLQAEKEKADAEKWERIQEEVAKRQEEKEKKLKRLEDKLAGRMMDIDTKEEEAKTLGERLKQLEQERREEQARVAALEKKTKEDEAKLKAQEELVERLKIEQEQREKDTEEMRQIAAEEKRLAEEERMNLERDRRQMMIDKETPQERAVREAQELQLNNARQQAAAAQKQKQEIEEAGRIAENARKLELEEAKKKELQKDMLNVLDEIEEETNINIRQKEIDEIREDSKILDLKINEYIAKKEAADIKKEKEEEVEYIEYVKEQLQELGEDADKVRQQLAEDEEMLLNTELEEGELPLEDERELIKDIRAIEKYTMGFALEPERALKDLTDMIQNIEYAWSQGRVSEDAEAQLYEHINKNSVRGVDDPTSQTRYLREMGKRIDLSYIEDQLKHTYTAFVDSAEAIDKYEKHGLNFNPVLVRHNKNLMEDYKKIHKWVKKTKANLATAFPKQNPFSTNNEQILDIQQDWEHIQKNREDIEMREVDKYIRENVPEEEREALLDNPEALTKIKSERAQIRYDKDIEEILNAKRELNDKLLKYISDIPKKDYGKEAVEYANFYPYPENKVNKKVPEEKLQAAAWLHRIRELKEVIKKEERAIFQTETTAARAIQKGYNIKERTEEMTAEAQALEKTRRSLEEKENDFLATINKTEKDITFRGGGNLGYTSTKNAAKEVAEYIATTQLTYAIEKGNLDKLLKSEKVLEEMAKKRTKKMIEDSKEFQESEDDYKTAKKWKNYANNVQAEAVALLRDPLFRESISKKNVETKKLLESANLPVSEEQAPPEVKKEGVVYKSMLRPDITYSTKEEARKLDSIIERMMDDGTLVENFKGWLETHGTAEQKAVLQQGRVHAPWLLDQIDARSLKRLTKGNLLGKRTNIKELEPKTSTNKEGKMTSKLENFKESTQSALDYLSGKISDAVDLTKADIKSGLTEDLRKARTIGYEAVKVYKHKLVEYETEKGKQTRFVVEPGPPKTKYEELYEQYLARQKGMTDVGDQPYDPKDLFVKASHQRFPTENMNSLFAFAAIYDMTHKQMIRNIEDKGDNFTAAVNALKARRNEILDNALETTAMGEMDIATRFAKDKNAQAMMLNIKDTTSNRTKHMASSQLARTYANELNTQAFAIADTVKLLQQRGIETTATEADLYSATADNAISYFKNHQSRIKLNLRPHPDTIDYKLEQALKAETINAIGRSLQANAKAGLQYDQYKDVHRAKFDNYNREMGTHFTNQDYAALTNLMHVYSEPPADLKAKAKNQLLSIKNKTMQAKTTKEAARIITNEIGWSPIWQINSSQQAVTSIIKSATESSFFRRSKTPVVQRKGDTNKLNDEQKLLMDATNTYIKASGSFDPEAKDLNKFQEMVKDKLEKLKNGPKGGEYPETMEDVYTDVLAELIEYADAGGKYMDKQRFERDLNTFQEKEDAEASLNEEIQKEIQYSVWPKHSPKFGLKVMPQLIDQALAEMDIDAHRYTQDIVRHKKEIVAKNPAYATKENQEKEMKTIQERYTKRYNETNTALKRSLQQVFQDTNITGVITGTLQQAKAKVNEFQKLMETPEQEKQMLERLGSKYNVNAFWMSLNAEEEKVAQLKDKILPTVEYVNTIPEHKDFDEKNINKGRSNLVSMRNQLHEAFNLTPTDADYNDTPEAILNGFAANQAENSFMDNQPDDGFRKANKKLAFNKLDNLIDLNRQIIYEGGAQFAQKKIDLPINEKTKPQKNKRDLLNRQVGSFEIALNKYRDQAQRTALEGQDPRHMSNVSVEDKTKIDEAEKDIQKYYDTLYDLNHFKVNNKLHTLRMKDLMHYTTRLNTMTSKMQEAKTIADRSTKAFRGTELARKEFAMNSERILNKEGKARKLRAEHKVGRSAFQFVPPPKVVEEEPKVKEEPKKKGQIIYIEYGPEADKLEALINLSNQRNRQR